LQLFVKKPCKKHTKIVKAGLLNEDCLNYEEIHDGLGVIFNCYKYFREQLKNKSVEELNNLHNSMFNDTKRILVLITLDHDDVNEQTIFDTINRAGVRLSAADIIKNNIFKNCLDKCESAGLTRDDVCNIYDDKWADLFYKLPEDSNIWDEKRPFGNVQRTNLEFLLYCVACIRWGKQKDIFSGLEKVYSDTIEDFDYYTLEDLIEDIHEYGKLYKKFILDFKSDLDDEENPKYIKYDNGIERLLLILDKFGVQMFYPYILMRIKDVNGDIKDKDLIRDLKILESFVVRRRLSPQGVSDYATKCDMIIRNGIDQLINSDFVNADSALRDIDIRNYLLKVKPDTAKMLLFFIELYERRGAIHEVNALEYKFTLEHIMPKKWTTHWGSVTVHYDSKEYLTNSEEGRNIRNEQIQSLGNMTLLTSNLNSSVKNGTFEIKINGCGPGKPGYNKFTSLYLTKAIVDQYNYGDKIWDERKIQQRTKELCEKIIHLWPSFYDQQIVTNNESNAGNSDPDTVDSNSLFINKFTAEVLGDPIKLLREMEKKSS